MKNLSSKQRRVFKVLKAGGFMYMSNVKKRRFRLLDDKRNPIGNIQGRTVTALLKKELLTKKDDGSETAIIRGKKSKNGR